MNLPENTHLVTRMDFWVFYILSADKNNSPNVKGEVKWITF